MASEPCAPVCYSEREAEGPWGARLPWPPTSCRLASLVPQRSPEDAGGQELGAPKPITSSGPGMPRRPRGFRECPRACGVGRGAGGPERPTPPWGWLSTQARPGAGNGGAQGREPLASACHRPRQGPEPGPPPAAPRGVPPGVWDTRAEWTPGWALRRSPGPAPSLLCSGREPCWSPGAPWCG